MFSAHTDKRTPRETLALRRMLWKPCHLVGHVCAIDRVVEVENDRFPPKSWKVGVRDVEVGVSTPGPACLGLIDID